MFTSFASRVDLTISHVVSPSSKLPSAPLRLTQKAGGARESRKFIQFDSDKVFPAKDGIGSKLLSMVYAGAFATKSHY